MSSTQLQFLKRYTQVGLRTAMVAVVASAVSLSANAFQLEFDEDGELSGSINTIMSFGAQWRMQERDADLVGKANNDPRHESELALNRLREYREVPGLWSSNGDDGNLNYDQHDVTYAVAKITSDMNLSYEDFSFRAGWSFYFDEVNRNFQESRVSRFYREDNDGQAADYQDCATGGVATPCIRTNRPKSIEDEVGYNFFLYDLNLSYDFEIAEKFVTLRVGRQGVNWGESTFLVLGSINSVNPPNAYRLRIPGGDLKEIFKPVNMVFASIGLTDNMSLEAFYQLKWDRIDPDPVGSFFATSDIAGDGGDFGMLSFIEPEDPNNEKDGNNPGATPTAPDNVANDPSLDSLGQALGLAPSGRSVEVIKTNARLQEFVDELAVDGTDSCGTGIDCSGVGDVISDLRDARTDPRDEGQYGMKLSYYAEDLNGGTDLGFYYLNIHSRLPYASFIAAKQTTVVDLPAVLGGLGLPNQIPNPLEIFDNADTLKIFLEYPEDIEYYGLSYSTNVGDWAVSGELVYRPDYPFQIHTSDLTYAALAPAFGTSCLPEQGADGTVDSANTPDGYGGCTGDSRSVNRIAVPSFVEIFREGGQDGDFTTTNYSQAPRQLIRGYEELDVLQYDMTFLALPGTNPFGGDTWLVLFEAGFTHVLNMPEKNDLQFAGAGDDTPFSRSAEEAVVANGGTENGDSGPAALQALLVQNPDRQGANAFADDFSWGIRFISLLTYNDLLLGFNVEPLTGFFWDVNGVSPGPGGNFIEGRKTIFQGIRFNKGNWSGELRYTWFTGADERNAERDRDNMFLQFTYSF